MAWRIHDNVIRGEIDNRQRGVVCGRIWLHGVPQPIVLELQGNACADLAGCLLTFENPGETFPLPSEASLHLLQRGRIGDLTASRKVRVLDLPVEEAYERKKQGLPVPEHMANCLYLEWYSEANGRVVVESTEYKLTISPPAWSLTPEEERQRQYDAAEGFAGFMNKLSEAVEAQRHEPPEVKEWDEFDYEKFMRESDARTDKYSELLDKYMDHPDREQLIAKEMGWTWLEEAPDEEERGAASDSSAKAAEDESSDPAREGQNAGESYGLDVPDEMPELEPDPATEGVDWVRTADGTVKHPLSLRVFDSSMNLWRRLKGLGLRKGDDPDITTLLDEFQITSAKLAGALNTLAYGRSLIEGPFTVAYLKRALGHLHAAQAALERVALKNLLPAEVLSGTRAELFAIREEILRLMDEFRGRK